MAKRLLIWAGQSVLAFVNSHFDHHFNGFDAIKDTPPPSPSSSSKKPKSFNAQFLYPVVAISITVVQGLIGFQDPNEPDPDRELSFYESKRFVTHQIYPKQFWFFSDLIMIFGTVDMLVFYTSLTVRPLLPSECFLYLWESRARKSGAIQPNQVLSKWESGKVAGFRQRTKAIIKWTCIIWSAGVELYFTRQMTVNESMVVTRASILYWTILVPQFVFYGVYVNFIMVTYFVLTCRYHRIRQQSILNEFARLLKANQSGDPRRWSTKDWLQYQRLNRASVALNHYLTRSNRFWSLYLTYYFILGTFFICYTAYIMLIANTDLAQKSLFLGIGTNSLFSLVIIIGSCAGIVRANDHIAEANRVLSGAFQRQQRNSGGGGPGDWIGRNLLKAESLMVGSWEKGTDSQSGTTAGYRLLNDHRIGGRTFYYAFYNITVFFMLNFRTKTYDSK